MLLDMWLLGVAVSCLVLVVACDDREDRVSREGGDGAAPAGEGEMAMGGSDGPLGGDSAAGYGVDVANGGASGSDGTGGVGENQPCDGHDARACIDEVTGQPGEVGWALSSSWFLSGCLEKQAFDCVVPQNNDDGPNFDGRGAINEATLPIGGAVGEHYKVTFKFNAIAEAKLFDGGLRDEGDDGLPANDGTYDAFHRDGVPAVNSYNAWRLSVLDELGQPARHYFMNSFPASGGPGVSGAFEVHRTYLLSYSKSIVVIGGGSVVLRVHDPNTRAVANCGWEEDACFPRYLPNEPTDVALPALYPNYEHLGGGVVPTAQLNLLSDVATQPWQSQLGHLTVTAVEPTTAAVNHDFEM